MYTPPKFYENSPDKIFEFIDENSFGLIISIDHEGHILHSQTPLILSEDRTKLLGHVAKANTHWNLWHDRLVKILFQGAHSYISPSYYASSFNVPTWHYMTVAIEGVVNLVSDNQSKIDMMKQLVSHHEKGFQQPWDFDASDHRYTKLFEVIVFFEIEISDIQASFKLNQNKSKEDQSSVMSHLNYSQQLSHNQLIAEAMRKD